VSFEDDAGRLEALHHLGIRVLQPTYNRRNLLRVFGETWERGATSAAPART
jgi:microsomal dipeptidase-like Zn-dependent dipeptidase